MNMTITDYNKNFYETKWTEGAIHYLTHSFMFRYHTDRIVSILQKYCNHIYIYEIADYGCGIGIHTVTLANFFPNAYVHGFDLAENGIEVANKVHNKKNLTFRVGDITKDNFGMFDLISAFEVLEHVDDWQSLLTSLVAKTNKYLLLSFPTGKMRSYEELIGHVRNFKKKEVESFLETLGVKPITTLYAGFPLISPLYRDICKWFPVAYNNAQKNVMSTRMKILHQVAYFFVRYFTTKKYFGDHFYGLFQKEI